MSSLRMIPVTSPEQVTTVARLAREIWNEYYVPLIGRAQVDYMVAKFQTAAAMQAQIDEGYEYFLIHDDATPVGYAAIRHDAADARMFISKLYLLAGKRKSGAGRYMLAEIERRARERGATRLWLTVNKGNPSVAAYQRLGFEIAEAIVMDIGGGFVMDDYRMEKALTPG